MSLVIQPLANTYIVSQTPTLAVVPQAAVTVDSLLVTPSVILSLGATKSVPITYNAAGLFDVLLQAANNSQAASIAASSALVSTNATASVSTTATGSVGASLLTDLATLLGISITATSSSTVNTSTAVQSQSATTDQVLLAIGDNSLSIGNSSSLAITEAMVRLMQIHLYSEVTGLSTSIDTSGAAATLQNLKTSSIDSSISSLLSPNLVFPLATTSVGNDSTVVTAVDLAATNALLSAVDLTAPSTAAVSDLTKQSPVSVNATSDTVPTVVATPEATLPVAAVAVTPVATAATTSAATVNVDSSTATAGAVSNNFFQDYVTQALANIEGNPAYASTVAGLYMSTLILHSQQASAIALPDTSRTILPIQAVSRVSAVLPV